MTSRVTRSAVSRAICSIVLPDSSAGLVRGAEDWAFLAAVFLAGVFFAGVFFAGALVAEVFVAVVLFAGAFVAVVFFDAALAVFVVEAFLAGDFLAGDFLAGAFVAVVFVAVAFLVGVAAAFVGVGVVLVSSVATGLCLPVDGGVSRTPCPHPARVRPDPHVNVRDRDGATTAAG
jgi:hypothetical protein